VAESLTVASVVETLVDLDLVDLDADGPWPWPGEPDEADAYEPDWSQVHPRSDRPTTAAALPPEDMPLNPWSVFDEVRQRAKGGFKEPPPDVLDALAWYTPIHYFGLGMAIYIHESAVFDVAAAILIRLNPAERQDDANITGACRAAMSVLYLHEAFHHKIESLAIRYEIVERARRYLPYSSNVVIPLLRQRSDDVLEEALACAEMYRRFKTERLYRRGVPAQVRNATIEMLLDWFPTLPPSYRRAGHYLNDGPFDHALNTLMSQVQEATTTPMRDLYEWDLTPHMHRGLFDCQRITHILVPVGQKPLLPWIGHAPALPSVSSRKAIQRVEHEGWKIVAGRGKGSHVWLERDGWPPLNIPANRESLSSGIVKHIADALGVGVRVADLRF
jgi:predicted RNA binding protein YcfA (HicA-like mRNA interferase family)